MAAEDGARGGCWHRGSRAAAALVLTAGCGALRPGYDASFDEARAELSTPIATADAATTDAADRPRPAVDDATAAALDVPSADFEDVAGDVGDADRRGPNPSFEVVDPTCAPAEGAPLPLWPAVGEVLRTRTPRFRWRAPEGSAPAGARIELCADRPCSRILVSAVVRELAWRPGDPLPVEARFWRIVALRTTPAEERPSAARSMVLPSEERSPGPRERRLADFDGDGLDDEVTHGREVPRTIRVRYSGGAADTVIEQGPNFATPRDPLSGCPNILSVYRSDVTDLSLVGLGDVDGDGFVDALIAQDRRYDLCARPFWGASRSFFLALGGPTGLRTPVQRLESWSSGAFPDGATPLRILPGEDLDDDGYEDLVYASSAFNPWCAHADLGVVKHGGPDRCARGSTTLSSAAHGSYAIPDIDGDGVPEVCAQDDNSVSCYTIRGRAPVLWQPPQRCLGVGLRFLAPCDPSRYQSAPSVSYAYDENSDGYGDLRSRVELPDGTRTSATFFGGEGGLRVDRCRIDRGP